MSQQSQMRFVNPSDLPHPVGYSHAVEVRRLFRDDLLIEIDAIAVIPA